MSRRPEDIRREIDQARGDLGVTLEAIGDRVSPKLAKERAMAKVTERVDEINERVNPKRIAQRRSQRVRQSLQSARESVMGTVDDVEPAGVNDSLRGGAQRASRRVGEAKRAVGSGVGAAPEVVRAKTEGNPLLAGLVAFGGGLVLASALKTNETERQAAYKILQELEPVKEQLMSAGKSIAGEIQQSAQGRAEQVKKKATSSTQRLKSEAQASAEDVKGQAQGASSRVQERAQGASTRVQKRTQRASQEVRNQAQRSGRAAKKAAPARRPASAGRST